MATYKNQYGQTYTIQPDHFGWVRTPDGTFYRVSGDGGAVIEEDAAQLRRLRSYEDAFAEVDSLQNFVETATGTQQAYDPAEVWKYEDWKAAQPVTKPTTYTQPEEQPETVDLKTPDGKTHTVRVGSDAYNKYMAQIQGGGTQTLPAERSRTLPTINYNYDSKNETAAQYNERIARERAAYNAAVAQQGQGGTTGGATGGTTGGSTRGATPMPTTIGQTGNPELDAMLGSLEKYLQELEKRGQVLNPNIKIDEKTLAQFTKQAEQEIDPYYRTQLAAAREKLMANAGYARDEIVRNEQELDRKYQQDFRQLGESAADRGFALSGIRQREEGNLATDTQNTINTNRRNLEFDLGNTARDFAMAYGSTNMPNIDIGNAPRVLGGENKFASTPGNRNLYQLDPNVYAGLVGSQEFERRGNVRNRASQLESAFRSNQALTQQRSLTL